MVWAIALLLYLAATYSRIALYDCTLFSLYSVKLSTSHGIFYPVLRSREVPPADLVQMEPVSYPHGIQQHIAHASISNTNTSVIHRHPTRINTYNF